MQVLKEWKCLNCEKEMEYDNSNLCLHCWCEANNMSCQCGYAEEDIDSLIEMEKERKFDAQQQSIETDSCNTT